VFANDLAPFPTDWLPAFERRLAKGDLMGAEVAYIRGMRMNAMARLPTFVLRAAMSMILTGEHRKEAFDLLPTLPVEFRMVLALVPRAERYESLACEVLLMSGGKSPASFDGPLAALMAAVPQIERRDFPCFDHGSPIFGDLEPIAEALRNFLSVKRSTPMEASGAAS